MYVPPPAQKYNCFDSCKPSSGEGFKIVYHHVFWSVTQKKIEVDLGWGSINVSQKIGQKIGNAWESKIWPWFQATSKKTVAPLVSWGPHWLGAKLCPKGERFSGWVSRIWGSSQDVPWKVPNSWGCGTPPNGRTPWLMPKGAYKWRTALGPT